MKMVPIKKSLSARELPADWLAQGQFAPDDRVTVWIEPEDPELASAASLKEIMNLVGKRAEKRGLTKEKLEDILNEA